MTRTLADMTPAERQQMIGMWAAVPTERRAVIITGAEGATVRWIDPGHPQRWGMTPGSSITPRFDLPRAWAPSGEPVPGEWEESASTPGIHRWCARWEQKTDEQPRQEDVKPDPQPGEAWLIEYEGKRYEAVYWYSPIYAHWAFVENREGLKTVESPEATPLSRLLEGGSHEPR